MIIIFNGTKNGIEFENQNPKLNNLSRYFSEFSVL